MTNFFGRRFGSRTEIDQEDKSGLVLNSLTGGPSCDTSHMFNLVVGSASGNPYLQTESRADMSTCQTLMDPARVFECLSLYMVRVFWGFIPGIADSWTSHGGATAQSTELPTEGKPRRTRTRTWSSCCRRCWRRRKRNSPGSRPKSCEALLPVADMNICAYIYIYIYVYVALLVLKGTYDY